MNETDLIEQPFLRTDVPEFRPGDTVKVHVRVVEGNRERVQVFQGVVIRRQGGGIRETFTVRKISFGVGVERTFPVHSPSIAKLELVSGARVRRAKLYYLRDLRGKKARIKERRIDDAKLAAMERPLPPEPRKPLTTTTRWTTRPRPRTWSRPTRTPRHSRRRRMRPQPRRRRGRRGRLWRRLLLRRRRRRRSRGAGRGLVGGRRPGRRPPIRSSRTAKTRFWRELPPAGPDRARPRDHHQDLPGAGVLHPVALDGADP